MGTKRDAGREHRFGGEWTEAKLQALKKYLHAYMQIMKKRPQFKTAYIDAFAGTGWRSPVPERTDVGGLFPEKLGNERGELLEGSVRIALKTEPPFDAYIFFERNAEHCQVLEGLGEDLDPDLSDRIRIEHGDANRLIQELCSKSWNRRRAVLFLDPYGAQIEWETLKAVANTRAIDLWLLFPLGVAVNRMLTRTGKIPSGWQRRLDILLGTGDWREAFCKVQQESNLFGEPTHQVIKASLAEIGAFFVDRLRSIFAGVAPPGDLRNSNGNPLYLFCFAVGNPNAVNPAIKIADHVLKDLR